ncbi:biotin--[acetyl-CoA-carboxylase] ligase [Flavobacterium zepuense]|uniref:Biotin--[acetyl-CoA-carboxylase] ligase n=1 Tax=Flavobacterium zepuense TaxID=2593302 RepID=A0A552V0J1_9FLAO|nr:biotin--[acetyl-CoA-carboxylase] ligase [Flavobacterium zepuense]TRW23991.1 biotin--[acetyl-CoA-carboxylase] ligase [Flavobacterium zepuense]
MNIIKLNAINSTNDYLKQLTATRHVEHFTIVVAENQTQGRGQMGSAWNAEPGKNLTFSILVKDLLLQISEIFTLNVAVAISIAQALETFNIPLLSIKWPNDILAGNKKVGGILIENSIKNNGEIFSIIGIGLNVNQQNFDGLPKASSIAVAARRNFDKEAVMLAIAEQLNRNLMVLLHKDAKTLWDNYHQKLYKKGLPMPFEQNGKTFMGIIQGVNYNGSLQVLLADDSIAEYNIKEVQLLY